MNLERRLVNPFVTRQSLCVHDRAQSSYEVWTRLQRQFEDELLTTFDSELDPLHAIRDMRGNIHTFGGFASYQAALANTMGHKKTQVSILCYLHLKDSDIEALSLTWLLQSIATSCLDRTVGLEHFRKLLNDRIDRRVLKQVCGTRQLSRREMSRRAGVTPSVLKSQRTGSESNSQQKRSIRRAIAKRMST